MFSLCWWVWKEQIGKSRQTYLRKYLLDDALGIQVCCNMSPHWYVSICTLSGLAPHNETVTPLGDHTVYDDQLRYYGTTALYQIGRYYSVTGAQDHVLSLWNVVMALSNDMEHYTLIRRVQDRLVSLNFYSSASCHVRECYLTFITISYQFHQCEIRKICISMKSADFRPSSTFLSYILVCT